MKKNIACIVLNYNNYEETIKCVDNIIAKKCNVDVVVPDNNSINESFKVLNDKYKDLENVFVIKNRINGGYSAGNNLGIKFIIDKNPDILYLRG